MRGARGRCPCQHPSDSGAAHVTACEAVIGWVRPGQFRRVCPLLERGPDGRWCCSVAATQVRPFWGRALVAGLALAAAVWLILTLVVFGVLRTGGFELSLAQVAWPPALRAALPRAQAARFIHEARAAYADGRINEAMVALQSAWQEDSSNYAVGLLLAQFSESTDLAGAGRIYAHLRATHPEKGAEVAQAWIYTLLAHGDFADAAKLAHDELAKAPTETAWLHALIFACRQTHDPGVLEKLSNLPGGLAEPLRAIVTTEAAALRGTLAGDELRRRLAIWPAADAPAYAWHWRIERLLMGKWVADAMAGLTAAKGHLADRDAAPLLLAAYATAGDNATRASEIKMFVTARTRLSDAEVVLLCAHLVRYPLPEAIDAVAEAWRRDARPPDAARLPLAFSLYCAAGIGRDERLRAELTEWIRQAGGGKLPSTLEPFAVILRSPGQERLRTRLLPTLPTLPLDVLYALISN